MLVWMTCQALQPGVEPRDKRASVRLQRHNVCDICWHLPLYFILIVWLRFVNHLLNYYLLTYLLTYLHLPRDAIMCERSLCCCPVCIVHTLYIMTLTLGQSSITRNIIDWFLDYVQSCVFISTLTASQHPSPSRCGPHHAHPDQFSTAERLHGGVLLLRYYEFEVITPGNMKVGWIKADSEPGKELGLDGSSYVFDGVGVSQPAVCYLHF